MSFRIGLRITLAGVLVAFGGGAGSAVAEAVVSRSEFSETTRSGGGFKTKVATSPLNFERDGDWQRVDTSLEPAGSGKVAAAAVDGEVEVPASAGAPIVVGHEGREVSLKLVGASGGSRQVTDSTASFTGVLPGVSTSYTATARGVKEIVTLGSGAQRVLEYELRGPRGWSANVLDGQVVLKDSGGGVGFRIAAPLAWDSADSPAYTNDLDLAVSKVSDGRWTLTLTPDPAWLSDPARVWPAKIDPDIWWDEDEALVHGTAADCTLASGAQADTNLCAANLMYTGYDGSSWYHSLAKFDLSWIPQGTTINAAKLWIYRPTGLTTDYTKWANHRVRTVTSSWDPATVTWNKRNATTNWATAGGDVSTDPTLIGAPLGIMLAPTANDLQVPKAAVQGWVDGTLTNHGLHLSANTSPTPDVVYGFGTNEATNSAHRPLMEFTWTPPVVDNTPPSAPSDIDVEPLDPEENAVFGAFAEGVDTVGSNGAAATGVERSELRASINGAAYTDWTEVAPEVFSVSGVDVGDAVTLQARTRDVASNTSSVTSFSLVVDWEDPNSADPAAVAWFADEYGVSVSPAEHWMWVQQQAISADSYIRNRETEGYAGLWLDNDTRVAHFLGTTTSAIGEIEAVLDEDYGIATDSSVTQVNFTEEDLTAGTAVGETPISDLVAAGQVLVYPDLEFQTTVFEVATGASLTTLSRVAAARSSMSTPSVLVTAPATDLRAEKQGCSRDAVDSNIFGFSTAYWSCTSALRGGTAITSRVNGDGWVGLCTLGFISTGENTYGASFLTAGHCLEDVPANPSLPVRVADDVASLRKKSGGHHRILEVGGVIEHVHAIDRNHPDKVVGADAGSVSITRGPLAGVGKLRPWVYQHAGQGAGRESSRHTITKVAIVKKGTVVCMSGARTGATSCGKVLATGLVGQMYARASYCPNQPGDSGGPVYYKGTAYGINIAAGPQCQSLFIGATTAQDLAEVDILTPSRARRLGYYGTGGCDGLGTIC